MPCSALLQLLTRAQKEVASKARATSLAAAPPAGAHVVAPCPHDGACPMDGTRSWCHFPQRFTRTRLQRSSKVLPGGHPARPYQDERFSYVVLRRQPRPTSSSAVLEIAQQLLKNSSPEPGASRAKPVCHMHTALCMALLEAGSAWHVSAGSSSTAIAQQLLSRLAPVQVRAKQCCSMHCPNCWLRVCGLQRWRWWRCHQSKGWCARQTASCLIVA